ncbi:MAG: threonylcarbamoyl-AMP synthase [Candidatus Moranbacteria bacterium CG06_land_8_20_14_3_00_43_56]|nr:MAG: threonylcarbamoyl-AMP synthase [Candidatus Moranbacteria bacterium CG06_land_8_20_14_3_00_43_56]PIV83980.1 MAG: threonylcarbamoyl-AMP synthase [Candidatus Moranbacteria bacterium CG17_big_fil_post_rev_8_21_14_2_50_44_12]PIW93557.1 MAG: threonylcarbamoyl-AMP synthase [Candidatus Moranbacteria bacterium CG_4_8_14_3_um_filter_43_15]PJA85747.1 MAG: threonylcarbamoyl-AMP synthase [Candidatus Moranbacteria bacterium CG_4_9_14_3_um_filter_44_28]
MNCVGAKKILEILKHSGTGVIFTDTIYGIAASVWSKKAIERAYRIMRRNKKKPFIILISSIKDLKNFNIKLDKNTENILKQIWPGKVSVILPVPSKKFQYLHRGTKTLAFRVPKKPSLIKLLKKTGPLVSTSANPQGKKPAETIAEAKKYFGDRVDFYASGGKMNSLPSTLIEIKNGKIDVLREGAGKVPKHLINSS